jgi:hypothetical protein
MGGERHFFIIARQLLAIKSVSSYELQTATSALPLFCVFE